LAVRILCLPQAQSGRCAEENKEFNCDPTAGKFPLFGRGRRTLPYSGHHQNWRLGMEVAHQKDGRRISMCKEEALRV